MSKESLINYLNANRQTGTFTAFAVMVWAKPDELESWKVAFNQLVDEGMLIPVEKRMLGYRYMYLGGGNETAAH